MNIWSEMEAFFNCAQFGSTKIVPDAQALWFALVYINNKCSIKVGGTWYRRVEFTVSNQTLLSMVPFSRQQLDKMRNLLIQAGRIRYKKGRGSQSGTYTVIPFDATYVTQTVTQPETQTETQVWQKRSTLIDITGSMDNPNIFTGVGDDTAGARASPGTLPMLDQYFGMTEEVKREVTDLARDLFTRYFSRAATEHDVVRLFEHTRISQQLPDGSWHVSLDDDRVGLVEYAVEKAATANAPNWRYINGILDNLRQRGLRTRDDCEGYDVDREFARNGH